MNVTTSGTPEQLLVKRGAVTTIAFNDNSADADTITDSGNGFLIAGFQPEDRLTVSGSSSNDGTFIVETVTAGTITLRTNEVLTTEAASASITLTAPKAVTQGAAVVIKASNSNSGNIIIADSSAKALNTTTGGFILQKNESVELQIDNISVLWLDCTINGETVEVLFEKALQQA